jgi:tetratricopeptide (TPR) repeat protein
MSTRHTVNAFLPVLLAAVALLSCKTPDSYFVAGSPEQREELTALFSALERQDQVGEARFIPIQQISSILLNAGEVEKLNLFLTTYVERHPKDPFNGYYLLLVAENYKDRKAYPFAVSYYERILKNYPDLFVRGNSVHLHCLQELISLVDEPEYRVDYYKELIARFSDQIDSGSTYFYLAKTYEELGEWSQAFHAYMSFLSFPGTVIPGRPEAARNAKSMVDFYNSDKRWTMDSLQQLVNSIKWAIRNRDHRTLERYMAKVSFFTMSWEQDEAAENSQMKDFVLQPFLLGPRVGYRADLEPFSNEHEAYLKTWDWSYRIQTWYLYFRKVHYPADPEINGRWEWAGIYFGEKL